MGILIVDITIFLDVYILPNFILISACSIVKNHAVITNVSGDFEIKPASQGAKLKVNGTPLVGPQVLEDKDRVLFGEQTYVTNMVDAN